MRRRHGGRRRPRRPARPSVPPAASGPRRRASGPRRGSPSPPRLIYLTTSHASGYEGFAKPDHAPKEVLMEEPSPARLYCLLVGGVLVIAGIIGFFYEASFATGDSIRTSDVFGILSVNGWHNVVH